MKQIITLPTEEEQLLIAKLRESDSPEAQRICRMYDMPDLSRTPWNPVNLIVEQILALNFYKDFDVVQTPEIVGLYETFDLFDFAPDHPARSKSDTYFVTEDKILRTHTTVLWYYYLTRPDIQEKLQKEGKLKALSRWKVYRRDEIDRDHYPVFHQIDGLYLVEKDKEKIWKPELAQILKELAISLYGADVECRIMDDTFPYTEPSLQAEVKYKGKRLEILGSGVVKPSVLKNLGIDADKYNGRAFGPGIERLAMPRMDIPDIRIMRSQDARITSQRWDINTPFQEISKYPSTYRDISFIISKETSLNEYFDIVRDVWGALVEQVKLLDTYADEQKFWKNRVSYTFRVIYTSYERTLTNEEVNAIQADIRAVTKTTLDAELR